MEIFLKFECQDPALSKCCVPGAAGTGRRLCQPPLGSPHLCGEGCQPLCGGTPAFVGRDGCQWLAKSRSGRELCRSRGNHQQIWFHPLGKAHLEGAGCSVQCHGPGKAEAPQGTAWQCQAAGTVQLPLECLGISQAHQCWESHANAMNNVRLALGTHHQPRTRALCEALRH